MRHLLRTRFGDVDFWRISHLNFSHLANIFANKYYLFSGWGHAIPVPASNEKLQLRNRTFSVTQRQHGPTVIQAS